MANLKVFVYFCKLFIDTEADYCRLFRNDYPSLDGNLPNSTVSMLCHFLPTAYCRHFVRMVVFGRIEQKNNQSRMVGTMGFLPPFIIRVVPHLHNASIFHPFVFLMLRIIMTRIWVFSFIFSLIWCIQIRWIFWFNKWTFIRHILYRNIIMIKNRNLFIL